MWWEKLRNFVKYFGMCTCIAPPLPPSPQLHAYYLLQDCSNWIIIIKKTCIHHLRAVVTCVDCVCVLLDHDLPLIRALPVLALCSCMRVLCNRPQWSLLRVHPPWGRRTSIAISDCSGVSEEAGRPATCPASHVTASTAADAAAAGAQCKTTHTTMQKPRTGKRGTITGNGMQCMTI